MRRRFLVRWDVHGEGELIGRPAHKKIKQALSPARQPSIISFNLHARHFTDPGWTNAVQPKLFGSGAVDCCRYERVKKTDAMKDSVTVN